MEQKKNYTLPIIMMFLLFAMISFVTGLSNPLGVIVKNQFAVANWMSQLGNFANFIAYAVMGIPAGMMLKRIGYKKTALAAVAVGFVGVGIQYLSGIAGSFPVYLIGAFSYKSVFSRASTMFHSIYSSLMLVFPILMNESFN
jgi:FHS family L-fucose permease-like MFS transporter